METPAIAAVEQIQSFPYHDRFEEQALSVDERCLTEVDNFNRHRRPDGSHDQWTLDEVLKNLVTAAAEAAMPYMVTKTEHGYQQTGEIDETGRQLGAYMWLGQTAVQNAASGRRYHKHPAALERVEVEVDEARDAQANLQPGMTKIFISPRMSAADAPHKVAKAEHLADDDSVRISRAITDEYGNIEKRELESLLVRDIPLEAWVAFLEDPNNIFAKSISIDNPESALSVMKVHRELEVPDEALPEGVVSIIEAVAAYIQVPETRSEVERQLVRFRTGQQEMHNEAKSVASRWLGFETELADSLHDKRATFEVESFINTMQSVWGEKDLAVILEHQLPDSPHYRMSRKLAVVLEKAKQNVLWVPVAVVTGNEKVLAQMEDADIRRITNDEMFLRTVIGDGYGRAQVMTVEADMNRYVARRNVTVGGGCPGSSEPSFNGDDDGFGGNGESRDRLNSNNNESRIGTISRGRCVVKTCPTRPNEVRVGGCGVCLGRCQKLYDKGKDPTKMGTVTKAAGKNTVKSEVFFVTPPAKETEKKTVKLVGNNTAAKTVSYSYN